MAMRQMPAMRKVHTQYLIAIRDCGEVDTHVCLGAAVRLNVCMLCTKEFLSPINRRLLDHVNKLTSSVISLFRITLGVLVRKNGAHCFEHRFADEIFRGNQFQSVALTRNFIVNSARDDRIDLSERCVKLCSGQIQYSSLKLVRSESRKMGRFPRL